MKVIYLAGGCFWGTEHFLKKINGVVETEVGYANSRIPHPTYHEVCTGGTGAVEAVKVVYDPRQVSLPFLISLYFKTIDPTSLNQQGNDYGTQYRTGIYYTDPEQKPVIEKIVSQLSRDYTEPVVVEVSEIENFYSAEGYHQDYLDNNPGGYCHINPSLFKLAAQATDPSAKYKRKTAEELRRDLTPLQYRITQESATERPFDNAYDNEFRRGIYVDVTTGQPLFLSSDKFNSGCGWPAFSKPISESVLYKLQDKSHGMNRTEVRSRVGDAHLGHVFNDGPAQSGGLRYCINSAALRFIPEEEMLREGYSEYLPLPG